MASSGQNITEGNGGTSWTSGASLMGVGSRVDGVGTGETEAVETLCTFMCCIESHVE